MESLTKVKVIFDDVFNHVGKVVVGQQDVIRQIVIAILTDSNALLEGYPGLAKTLSVRTLARLLDMKFTRIQGTPDLMPSDITGTYVLEEGKGGREFKFQPGPLFANVVLMDEINRATAKTQSALLEAMQEKQVTVGNNTFQLDKPFFVLATQNPIEQEGSLDINETVFVNGTLQTGKELLQEAKQNMIRGDKKGVKLYDLNAWTYSLNIEGKLEKQKCFFYTLPYKEELIEITTKTGKKISVTKNHPFLVNDKGTILWKKAEDLTKEDYLINPARLQEILPSKIISHKAAVSCMTQKSLKKEILFNKDFAFWIACVLSDGSIAEKSVQFCQKNYPHAMERFISISRKYGFRPYIYQDRTGCTYATIYSKPLVEYLWIRFGIRRGKDKEIPSCFLSFPKHMAREFIKIFIMLESSLRDNRIVFTQKNKKDINILSYMLLRFGILSWIREDKNHYPNNIWRLKIQGEDLLKYFKRIGWCNKCKKIKKIDVKKKIKSSFRVVPINRKVILHLVQCLGLNSLHMLKGRKTLTDKKWYGGYKGIKDGEIVMSKESLFEFVKDIKNEINERKKPSFQQYLDDNPRYYGASVGLSLTEIADSLNISKNQVWNLYKGSVCIARTTIKTFLKEKFMQRIVEVEKLLAYCEGLLSEDIYYDKIKKIEYNDSGDLAFGLTVPTLQNYVAGFGGCGINHNTYPLPEAQSDRFLLKIRTDYPSFDEELEIVSRLTESMDQPNHRLKPLISKQMLAQLQAMVRKIPIANDIKRHAVDLVNRTRQRKELIEYGASPRASIGLILAAKANALLDGRNFVTKQDINTMAYPILRHRIILNFEAERNNFKEDDVIKYLLK